MTLPGKLIIGFLQEDNPVKSFFRVKPLAAGEDAGALEPIEDIKQLYPDDGFIRIVPDKNEITQFKNRMRQMGRYCALDLRAHPGETDKIRPNKNYAPAGAERNNHIVYSDVIDAMLPEMAAEVVDATGLFASDTLELRACAPGTPFVLVRRESTLSGPWVWTDGAEGSGLIRLSHAPDREFFEKEAAPLEPRMLSLNLEEGAAVRLMIEPRAFGLSYDSYGGEPQQAGAGAAQPGPAFPGERAAEPAPPEEPALERAETPEEKPAWITRATRTRLAVSTRLSPREKELLSQIGINPRRGRSLSEIVDEQWRKSRCDQLGHPVPAQATGRPVLSPVDRAAEAVDQAWALDDARASLVLALMKNEELTQALRAGGKQAQGVSEDDGALHALEADRLRLIGEIDALRAKRADAKAELMAELVAGRQDELDKYERKKNLLLEELKHNERAADSARKAAEAAERLLNQTESQLEDQLLSAAMGGRARDLLRHMAGLSTPPCGHPETYEPTAGELISDLRVRMDSAGFSLSNDEAVGVLCALMSCGTLVVSGPVGCGKTTLCKSLAAALGLSGAAGRFVQARSADDDAIYSLLEKGDHLTPLMVLIDDFNTSDSARAAQRVANLQERALSMDTRLFILLTCQDPPDGQPISARLLSRAFFLRMRAPGVDTPFKPRRLSSVAGGKAVSLSALERLFAPAENLPGEIEARISRLRAALEKAGCLLDRRTLNQLWNFCASAREHMTMDCAGLLDLALKWRVMPALLAGMDLNALHELPSLIPDMPRCLSLMDQPLPLPPL